MRNYIVREGYLWHCPRKPGELPQRVIGTAEERKRVMNRLHDAEATGHHGIARTYAKAKERYFWPGMYRDVEHYVETCEICQRFSQK